MLKTIRRLALIVSCGATATALFALSAQAAAPASSAITQPATHVTSYSAQLNATINTHGQRTEWQFYWGRSSRYGRSTKPRQIIQAGTTKPVKVSWTLRNLQANTSYDFTIVTYSGIGTNYLEKFVDHRQSFTTNRFVFKPTHHVKPAATSRPQFVG